MTPTVKGHKQNWLDREWVAWRLVAGEGGRVDGEGSAWFDRWVSGPVGLFRRSLNRMRGRREESSIDCSLAICRYLVIRSVGSKCPPYRD